MTRETTFGRICFIIKEQLYEPELSVTQTTTLHDDLGVDSTALMEFIIGLEDEFHSEILDGDVENMKCTEKMMGYLYNHAN